MLNLQIFFTIPFPPEEIALTRLLKFGARSLSRMTHSNPDGFLDERIAATTTALASVETGVSDVGIKEAIKQAKTEAKEGFRTNLPAHIRRIYGAVAGAFGDPSTELTECFPEGRSIYSRCKDEELNNKLAQLVACISPLSAQVGAAIVTLAGNLKTQWEQIFSAQDQALSDREAKAGVRNTARETLALDLFLNLLAVAAKYPGDVAKCDYYFPQQYLRRPSPRTVPEQATLTADPFNDDTRKVVLHGSSDGAEKIRFERRMAGETDFSPIAIVTTDEGSADYEDTLSASGDFEYQAIGVRGTAEGEASAVLIIHAT